MQLCHNCKEIDLAKETPAERFCIKCEEKLCISCSQEHKRNREHLVVDLIEQEETKKSEELDFCTDHKDRLADLYCVCCREVICGECERRNHSSHNCLSVGEAAVLISKQAETDILSDIQLHFDKEREKLSNEEIKVIKTVKDMETDIRKRCDEMTKFVYDETNALLKDLYAFRKERLEEIEMERRQMEKHAFTFEKFKIYCDQVKRNINPSYTCQAEGVLRNIADDLVTRPEGRWKSKLFSIDVSIQKTDIEQLFTALRDVIGKLTIRCPCRMTQSSEVKLDVAEVFHMTRLHDKLYLLSTSISIHSLQHPFPSVGEIKTPEIKSPKEIVSCSKMSCLYVYDNGEECIWKVSIASQQVCRWLSEVKEPCTISVASNAELLMLRSNRPVCLEVYDKHAILSRRLNFPSAITSMRSLYETSSGGYIGQVGLNLATFGGNGSLIGQFDPPERRARLERPLFFELSPYHIFLHCVNDYRRRIDVWDDRDAFFVSRNCTISSVNADLEHHKILVSGSYRTPVNSCYLKNTKKLIVLEKVAVDKDLTKPQIHLNVYDVLPA